MRRKRLVMVICLCLLLTACNQEPAALFFGKDAEPVAREKDTKTKDSVEASDTTAENATSEPTPTPAVVPGFKQQLPESERYVHGDEGYYCLADDGIPVHLRAQEGGTCWLYASTAAMETSYEKKTGQELEIDPMGLLPVIYGGDKEEGIFLKGANAKEFGGLNIFVINTLSNGFGYHNEKSSSTSSDSTNRSTDENPDSSDSITMVLDNAIVINKRSPEKIKEGIRRYGAASVGIPDRIIDISSKKGYFNGYTTLNWVTDDVDDYDHSVAIIGWDDHFPKDYFKDPASQDGAWIAYNSRSNDGYYYISYDTDFDWFADNPTFMSVSDEYSAVESYDAGNYGTKIQTGEETTVANIFHKKGTLSAVGTFCLGDEQDIVIEVWDSRFENCMCTQPAHLDHMGYITIRLDEPVEVEDYALVIRYDGAAPVEGKNRKEYDGQVCFRFVSEPGQSYVYLNDRWMDMAEKKTIRKLGCGFKPHNCNIKALYGS